MESEDVSSAALRQFHHDTGLGGYIVNLDRAQLDGAPVYNDGELSVFDPRCRNAMDAYYQPGLETGAVVNPGVTAPPLPR